MSAVNRVRTGLLSAAVMMSAVLLCAVEAPAQGAITRTPWQMHAGLEAANGYYLGVVPFSQSFPGTGTHGHPSHYAAATIPPDTDGGWGPAPNGETIGFGHGNASQIDEAGYGCFAAVDYTYFQTFVTIPQNATVNTFTISFSGMDDGSRITIFNSTNPGGLVIPGSYVYLGATATTNLKDYVVTGEVNRVVITQVDDCPVGNTLQVAQVVLNGDVIASNQPPVAVAKDITVTLDAHGEATIAPEDVDDGSYDPDNDPIALALDLTSFTCDDLGQNLVTLTVTDDEGAADAAPAVVTVVDATPPVVSFDLETTTLWPPNHKMVKVATGISAVDVCDAGAAVAVSVTSDEPVNGTGDGNTAPDWELVDGDLYLRAERDGKGDGRVYTITIVATDGSGNSTTVTATVDVPHDQSPSVAAASGGGKGKAKARKPAVSIHSIVPELSTGDPDAFGNITLGDGMEVAAGPSGLSERALSFGLAQNHPNPFNPETVIGYTLPEASAVRLVIYNLLGQEVRELVNGAQAAGQYQVRWDGRDAAGYDVTSGVYLYRLVAGSQVDTRRMLLLK